jgi:hypothetical protein
MHNLERSFDFSSFRNARDLGGRIERLWARLRH